MFRKSKQCPQVKPRSSFSSIRHQAMFECFFQRLWYYLYLSGCISKRYVAPARSRVYRCFAVLCCRHVISCNCFVTHIWPLCLGSNNFRGLAKQVGIFSDIDKKVVIVFPPKVVLAFMRNLTFLRRATISPCQERKSQMLIPWEISLMIILLTRYPVHYGMPRSS